MPPEIGIDMESIIFGSESAQTVWVMGPDGVLIDSGMTSADLGLPPFALPEFALLNVNLNDAVLRGTNRFG